MYLTVILTEEQSISRQVHEDDQIDYPVGSEFIKEETRQLYTPDCPNCKHSYHLHTQTRRDQGSSGCCVTEEGMPASTTNSRTGESFILLNSISCGCVLSQADIKANVKHIAIQKRIAEQAEKERLKKASEYESQREAIRLAEERDTQIGHQPYYDCCEAHNRDYNGPGRVNSCRIQFRIGASGQVEHVFEEPNKAPQDQVGYVDHGYGEGV